MKVTMHQRYARVRKHAPLATPVVLLHIGEEQTGVASGVGTEPEQLWVLALGASRTSTEFFKHTPPSPLEIENAIMVVEDEVTRARAVALGHAPLYSTDQLVDDMVTLAGKPAALPRSLTIEQVERLFDQLAARSEGRAASQVDIPDDPGFAAALLILREFMHHLGFDSIQYLGGD